MISSSTVKKTKIVATLGPASNSHEKILDLALAGVDVFRLNFSHGDHADKQGLIDIIRDINSTYNLSVAILADLQGPKLRVSRMPEGGVTLSPGDWLDFTGKPQDSTAKLVSVSYARLSRDVAIGNRILLDDGKIEVEVASVDSDTGIIRTKVVQGGVLISYKGFNLPDTNTTLPALTKKDHEDLAFILKNNIEWIALSFVRRAKDVLFLRELLLKAQSKSKIIAKIEKPEAVSPSNIDDIIDVSDAIMIARGDLGVEVPIEQVPRIQRRLIRKCIQRAKPVIVATQMMESMIDRTKPNRSEVSDVANAVLEGTDAVMLSGETAVGKNPSLVIRTMVKIILETEKSDSYPYDSSGNHDWKSVRKSPTAYSEIICHSACQIAKEIGAVAIIGMTQSGRTGFSLSSFRPSRPLFVFANSELLTNQFSLSWGVRSFYYPQIHHPTMYEILEDQAQRLKERGFLRSGDIFVTTGSVPVLDKLPTNLLKIHRVK